MICRLLVSEEVKGVLLLKMTERLGLHSGSKEAEDSCSNFLVCYSVKFR